LGFSVVWFGGGKDLPAIIVNVAGLLADES